MKNKKENSEKEVQKPLTPPTPDFRLGDLDPIYIQYYAENFSREEFCKKYVTRKGRVPEKYHSLFLNIGN